MLNTLVAMGIATIINTNMKYALPKVDDIYYITENNEVCENVPVEDCFASVIKQGNKSYLSSEIDVKQEFKLHKGDNAIVVLNDVGEVVDVFQFKGVK
jgi:hypothetical protein